MTGKTRQEHDAGRSEVTTADTAPKKQDQDKEARVGKYGGDDGALEHESEEIENPEDTRNSATPAKKPSA